MMQKDLNYLEKNKIYHVVVFNLSIVIYMENKNVLKIILIIIITIILFKFTKKKEKFTNIVALTDGDMNDTYELITKIKKIKNGTIESGITIGGNLTAKKNLNVRNHITTKSGGLFESNNDDQTYTFEDTENAGRIQIGQISDNYCGIESIESNKPIMLGSESGEVLLDNISIKNGDIDFNKIKLDSKDLQINNFIKSGEELYFHYNRGSRGLNVKGGKIYNNPTDNMSSLKIHKSKNVLGQ